MTSGGGWGAFPRICAQSVDGVTVLDYNALPPEDRRQSLPTKHPRIRVELIWVGRLGAPLPYVGDQARRSR